MVGRRLTEFVLGTYMQWLYILFLSLAEKKDEEGFEREKS